MKAKYVIVLLLATVFYACANKKNEFKKLAKEWIGKEVIFPDKLNFRTLSEDSLDLDLIKRPCKILVYADSVGCTGCKFDLFGWMQLIKEVDDLYSDKVGFLFFINSENFDEVKLIMKYHEFDYPVILSEKNLVGNLNNIPANIHFQVFLLDDNNRVMLIGNPVSGENTRKLYMKTIDNYFR